ncbi:fructosamine kinase [Georgenia sp. 311]|uniref:fructosamine kinase family protein n=1 Tax=Georgenia sp. 311 TaxID=2585134 RepID=UPI001111E9BF|nr:fructosamine kinase family protein [Georgenia sp. 311]TNC18015.1 fructosamine kinase [Georgenia sp. 311]
MRIFHKTDDPETLRFEAAGLRWLADATDQGGAPVVEILGEGEGWLDLVHLPAAAATAEGAASFGRGLARTHAAGAPSFGCAPPGWRGPVPRSSGPMPLHDHDAAPVHTRWADFYAEEQIRPYVRRAVARGALDEDGARVLDRVADRLAAGDFDHDQPALVGPRAARLHGDLWGGNVVWTRDADGPCGVLIDPAAHGGHAETDLAALDLFGVDRLPDILAGYQEVSPLAQGWRERVGLHQLTMLIMHAVIFGGSYGPQTVRVARRYA